MKTEKYEVGDIFCCKAWRYHVTVTEPFQHRCNVIVTYSEDAGWPVGLTGTLEYTILQARYIKFRPPSQYNQIWRILNG